MGKIATKIVASGKGWRVGDVICTSGPQDRRYEEQHNSYGINVVLEGTFQYRSRYGSEVMSPGSLLLDNAGQSFECGHDHGTGDRCVSFQYTPELLERAGFSGGFRLHRIAPSAALTPWLVGARLAVQAPDKVSAEELAFGLAEAVINAVRNERRSNRPPAPADERRISAVLRFIEAHLHDRLPLERLASAAAMSEFHFLRVFRQVTGVTPHQYIVRARLREAAVRLKTRSGAVLDVALDAGFGDLSNFNHAFRSEFGVNPARFRL